MNKRHLVFTAALLAAGFLAFFGDKTPMAGIAEPVIRAADAARPVARVNAVVQESKTARMPIILALQDRTSLIGGAEVENAGGDIFNSHSWTPPPPPPPPPPKPSPPPPPMAPPLPFTYLGKKIEDGAWEIYLARGDQTFIVHAESVIDGIYKVETIQPPGLTLTYLPLNQKQTLTIGGAD